MSGFAGFGGSLPPLGPGQGGAPVTCQEPIAITTGTAAIVTANLDMVGRVVSPDLLGVHTSAYDGNMQLATTPDLLKAAGIGSMRYPGGSYADLYHWESHTATWTPAAGAGGNGIYIARDTDFGSFVGFLERVGARAVITVNYGMNPQGTGPGVPQEAAAWVAYANGDPASTIVIGLDDTGHDWKTVGYWATLRGAGKMPTDDGNNFLRISHPAPIGIKYWEIGNETYGNGYYHGNCGWEADLRVPYPPDKGTVCTGRKDNPALSPTIYGMAVKQYAAAMKAVDPTIKIGAVLVGDDEYPDWNAKVLGAACPSLRHRHPALVRGQRPHHPPVDAGGQDPRDLRACALGARDGDVRLPGRNPDHGDGVGTELADRLRAPDVDARRGARRVAIRGPVRRRVVREFHGAGRAGRPLARAAQQQLPRPDRLVERSVHPIQRRPALGAQGHADRPPAGGRQRHHRAGDGVGHLRRRAEGARVRARRRRHQRHDDEHQRATSPRT